MKIIWMELPTALFPTTNHCIKQENLSKRLGSILMQIIHNLSKGWAGDQQIFWSNRECNKLPARLPKTVVSTLGKLSHDCHDAGKMPRCMFPTWSHICMGSFKNERVFFSISESVSIIGGCCGKRCCLAGAKNRYLGQWVFELSVWGAFLLTSLCLHMTFNHIVICKVGTRVLVSAKHLMLLGSENKCSRHLIEKIFMPLVTKLDIVAIVGAAASGVAWRVQKSLSRAVGFRAFNAEGFPSDFLVPTYGIQSYEVKFEVRPEASRETYLVFQGSSSGRKSYLHKSQFRRRIHLGKSFINITLCTLLLKMLLMHFLPASESLRSLILRLNPPCKLSLLSFLMILSPALMILLFFFQMTVEEP